jgi:hypothetical protein
MKNKTHLSLGDATSVQLCEGWQVVGVQQEWGRGACAGGGGRRL